MKIILDPCLYWFDYTERRFDYLEEVIYLVENLFDIKYLSSESFINTLKNFIHIPMGKYKVDAMRKRKIISAIYKNLDYENNISDMDLNEVTQCLLPSDYAEVDDCAISVFFRRILTYVNDSGEECLLLLSLENHNIEWNKTNLIMVHHIYKEVNSIIAKYISEEIHIKSDFVKKPCLKNPLPNTKLCALYKQSELEMLDKKYERIPVLLDVGTEVALRNNYVFDELTTRVNSSAIRKIFVSKVQPYIYLSIDVRHGALEVCDSKGKHIDEYTYDNIPQNKQDESHSIIVVR